MNILMISIYFYELVLLFFIVHHKSCNNNVDNFFKGYVKCNNFPANEFLASNNVAIFNIHTDMFQPAQYVFIILVSLFMNIRFL